MESISLRPKSKASGTTKLDHHSTENDIKFSERALELARVGIGLVSPNPLVGCVVVSASGDVVGEGTYIYDSVAHAEIVALEKAGEKARGGTAYVSLEPHSHHGRTSPCTEALIEAGITRVVAPIEDPNPLVSGRGFQRLREVGIEVTTGIVADKAAQLNEKFIHWHRCRRPFVHLKLAISLDGRISLRDSVSTALSGQAARERVQELRHEHDAILVGGNTAFVDDPSLTDRSGLPRRRPLVRVILDNRFRIKPESQLVRTARDIPTIVVTTHGKDTSNIKELGVDVVEVPSGGRDLNAVLGMLAEREIQSVLVEGGTEVAGAFCDARLVDKVTFIAAPLIIGGSDAPNAIGGKGADSLAGALRLENVSVNHLGEDIEITGYPRSS
jgi:diaminohydroxyphosphoribosylaminopyrimidine deaminase/5-amino-6-(5-phosphoribosylamino)uracil reductase